MGIVLVLMETVGLYWYWSPSSIGGLLKPIHPNGTCPQTHCRKPFLMVKSRWFVMVFVVETIRISVMVSIVFVVFLTGLANQCYSQLLDWRLDRCLTGKPSKFSVIWNRLQTTISKLSIRHWRRVAWRVLHFNTFSLSARHILMLLMHCWFWRHFLTHRVFSIIFQHAGSSNALNKKPLASVCQCEKHWEFYRHN